jgi:hypothetical protein
VMSLYFKIFSAPFWIIFMYPEITTNTSTSIHVPFPSSRITMPGLLLRMGLSVCTWWFHSTVTLHPRLVSTDFGYYYFHHNHYLLYAGYLYIYSRDKQWP